MRLVSSFSKRAVSVKAHDDFLTEDAIRHVCPSVYATEAHESRSSKYNYISTAKLIEALGEEGFKPTFAAQQKPRDEARMGYTKHLLRFRRESDFRAGAGEAPEILALASHGGESSVWMTGGFFRFICLNGLIMGESFGEVKIRHTGRLPIEAIEAAHMIAGKFADASAEIEAWKSINLNGEEQLAYAEEASRLRLPPKQGDASNGIPAYEFLLERRNEDRGNSLWRIFNRVQENVIRGGMEGVRRDTLNRERHFATRAVNGIDQGIDLNRALWALTQRTAAAKRFS
jgi:hypothetical protein